MFLQFLVAALISALLLIGVAVALDDRPTRSHPDRDITRVERVVDVQLETM